MDVYNNYLELWGMFCPETNYNVISYIIKKLPKKCSYEVDAYNNIIVTKGGKEKKPIFCCHTDTVHSAPPKKINKKKGIITAEGGIGGDDKCGIITCLELLYNCNNIKVIFFANEESGGEGARAIDLEHFKDGKFIIEIDRMGAHDVIRDMVSGFTCDDIFIAAILKTGKKFKRQEQTGSYTDIDTITSRMTGNALCGVNISCGYYAAHTTKEYVVLKELENTIKFCIAIVNEVVGVYTYKKVEHWDRFMGIGGKLTDYNMTYKPKKINSEIGVCGRAVSEELFVTCPDCYSSWEGDGDTHCFYEECPFCECVFEGNKIIYSSAGD